MDSSTTSQTNPALADAVLEADSTAWLRTAPSEGFHLILTDIPYGIGMEDWDVLHSNTNSAYRGTSPAQDKAGKIFKSRGKPLNGWSEADRMIPREYYEWCAAWAPNALRIIKPGGSLIVFAGRRLQHRCTAALEDAGFTFKDMLAWIRPNAAHRAQRLSIVYQRRGDAKSEQKWKGWRVGNLRPSFEPILWFTKPYKIGTTIADNVLTHGVGGYNGDASKAFFFDDNIIKCGFGDNETRLHPTQKPVRLMEALISLTTKPGQSVLDPFCGSGSTLVAAKKLRRQFLGIDKEASYCEIARKRLGATESYSGNKNGQGQQTLAI